MYTEKMLMKLTKKELVEIILNNKKDLSEKYTDIVILKRNFLSGLERGKTSIVCRCSMTQNNILKISWKKLTPSGYGDNGIGDIFYINLNEQDINNIESNGFIPKVLSNIVLKNTSEINLISNKYSNLK